MSDTSRHFSSSDGRYRVAYEMALAMWEKSKDGGPKLSDKKEFLELVAECTKSLAYLDG